VDEDKTITRDLGGEDPPPTPPTPLGLAPGDHPRLSDPVKDRSGRASAPPDLTAGPVRLISDASI